MSTPVKEMRTIIIDADADSERRRLLDKQDGTRRIILNLCCDQCQRQILFNRCRFPDAGECIIEIVRARLAEGRGG